MRKFMLSAVSLFSLLLLTAFTNLSTPSAKKITNTQTEPLVYKMMELTYLWDLLVAAHEINRETDETWLEVGLRAKYAYAKNYASIAMLEQLAGTKVYNRGPHGEHLDFNSNHSFGYYNPEFLQLLRDNLEMALQNPAFKAVAAQAFHKHFEGAAETYHKAFLYQQEHADEMYNIRRDYLELIAQPQGTMDGSLQEIFRSYADNAVKMDKADWYEAVTAPSFWIRRSIDGTDAQFFELLDMLIEELGAKG